jgi:hypothetical protein
VESKTDKNGLFIMCGVPGNQSLRTRVISPGGSINFGTSRPRSADPNVLGGRILPGTMRAVSIKLTSY